MLEGHKLYIERQIKQWLEEDIGNGDITSLATIPHQHHSKAVLHVKTDGVLCGLPVAAMVFEVVDQHVQFTPLVDDGSTVSTGTIIAVAEGNTRSILQAERLALNILQRLSGIATKTKTYVQALDREQCRVVDTRKTTPGFRLLEKYAVRMGGGHNHRFGLYDAVLIKDNHIKASGGIRSAIAAARAFSPHTIKIEVEVESLAQLQEAIDAQADIIMLDNMDLATMSQAVQHVKLTAPHIVIEASGNVNLDTIHAIGKTGVDIISVGGLTSSVQSLDISLDLNERKEGHNDTRN